jgi:hypothetical protein
VQPSVLARLRANSGLLTILRFVSDSLSISLLENRI